MYIFPFQRRVIYSSQKTKKTKKKRKKLNKTKQGSYMLLIKKWDRMLNEITSNATHGKTS